MKNSPFMNTVKDALRLKQMALSMEKVYRKELLLLDQILHSLS